MQSAWENLNRVAHQELIAVLEDDTRGNITTGEGTVTLNLSTLVVNIGEELGFGEELDPAYLPTLARSCSSSLTSSRLPRTA